MITVFIFLLILIIQQIKLKMFQKEQEEQTMNKFKTDSCKNVTLYFAYTPQPLGGYTYTCMDYATDGIIGW